MDKNYLCAQVKERRKKSFSSFDRLPYYISLFISILSKAKK